MSCQYFETQVWGALFKLIADAIPRAETDNNQDEKVTRIAQGLGFSRSQFYDIMKGERKTKLIPVDAFFCLLALVQEEETLEFVLNKILQRIGYRVERKISKQSSKGALDHHERGDNDDA